MHLSEAEIDALAHGENGPEALAHCAGCETCHKRLSDRRAVHGLLQSLEPVEPTELEWKRIDRHVLEALAQRGQRPVRSWLPLAVPALGAAAALLVVGLKLLSVGKAPQVALPTAAVVAPAQVAVALAVGGEAHTGRPGPEILEGDVLDALRGSLQVQTAVATGIELAPGSRARATRLRQGETSFALLEGTLRAEVKPLARGAHFTVRAGDLAVHVVGTQFVVERAEGATRVAVVHGRVRVDREGGDAIEIPAGSELSVPDGAVLRDLALQPLGSAHAGHFPLGFPELAPDEVERQFGQAEIDSEPPGASAALDGAARGVTPLTVLAAEGPHEVQLQLAGHLPQRHTLHVSRTRAQATLAMALAPPPPTPVPVLPAPSTATAPEPARPTHPPAASAPIVAPPPQVSFAEAFHGAAMGHREEVLRCYRRTGGELARRLHVVLTIEATGRVSPPVSVQEPGADPAFIDCLNGAAATWTFPPPGREYEVAIPYELDPGR